MQRQNDSIRSSKCQSQTSSYKFYILYLLEFISRLCGGHFKWISGFSWSRWVIMLTEIIFWRKVIFRTCSASEMWLQAVKNWIWNEWNSSECQCSPFKLHFKSLWSSNSQWISYTAWGPPVLLLIPSTGSAFVRNPSPSINEMGTQCSSLSLVFT